MTRPVLPPPQSHRQLFVAITAMHTLLVNDPSFSPEQDVNPLETKPRSRLGEFNNPFPNGTIVTGMRAIIPTRAIESE